MAEIRVGWLDPTEVWVASGGERPPADDDSCAHPYLLLPVNDDGSVQVGRYRLCYESGSLLVTVHGDDPDDNEVNVCYALLDAAAEAVGGDDG